jgi:hypothetical protein
MFWLALLQRTYAHSWLECTDYAGIIQLPRSGYDVSLCRGFPRDWTGNNLASIGGFGLDRGYNYQPYSNNKRTCRDALDNQNDYTVQYPKATYFPNKSVTLLWPAKNHARIRNFGMCLYACCNQECTPDLANDISKFAQPKYLVKDWGRQEQNNEEKGFGKCEFLDRDTDKAVCWGDFVVPTTLSGECTFVWYWAFNSDTDVYTTCFEANVLQGTPGPSPTAAPTQAPTVAPTRAPTVAPTRAPVQPTAVPTAVPTPAPFPPGNTQISVKLSCRIVCE